MKVKQILFVAMFCAGAQLGCPIFGSEQRIQETGWRSWIPERFRPYLSKSSVAASTESNLRYDVNMLGEMGLLSVGGGLLDSVLQKEFKTEREYTIQELVNQLAQLIEPIITRDRLAYPTRSSRLHALLRRDEFYGGVFKIYQNKFGENIANEIFRLACDKVMLKIKDENDSSRSEQASLYEAIDKEIGQLNQEIAKHSGDAQTLSAKIRYISKKLLENPKCAAFVSVVLRLKNQQLVERRDPGAYRKAGTVEFYTNAYPSVGDEAMKRRVKMTPEQWKLYRQQKKAAETGKPLSRISGKGG